MNGFVNIDAPPDEGVTTALVTITAALPAILAADQNDILGKLAAKVNAHKPDISTPKGRAEIRSLAQEIATSKTALIKLGKTLTEDWRAKTKAVNAECNVIEEQMDALKVRVRQPLTDFENAEKVRVAAHEAALAAMTAFGAIPSEWGSAEIGARIEEFISSDLRNRAWQEFTTRASDLVADVVDRLNAAYTAAVNREEEAAELTRLRAEAEENRRQAAIRLQAERDAQIAKDAAEAAKRAAEAEAAQRELEAAAAARRAQEAIEAKATAEREAAAQRERQAAEALALQQRQAKEAADAAQHALEAEQKRAAQVAERVEFARLAAHQTALNALSKIAAPLEPPDPAVVIETKKATLLDVFERDWEEFSDEAATLLADSMAKLDAAAAERARIDRDHAEAEHLAEIERQRIADERAEITRRAEVAKVEREKAEAVAAERRRADAEAAAIQAEAEKRAANVAHRKSINGAALKAIVETMANAHSGSSDEANEIAKALITAVALGKIPHVSIKY